MSSCRDIAAGDPPTEGIDSVFHLYPKGSRILMALLKTSFGGYTVAENVLVVSMNETLCLSSASAAKRCNIEFARQSISVFSSINLACS